MPLANKLHKNLVVFAHGKESGPWGTKIQAMARVARKLGCHVESPDYSWTFDADKRVAHLIAMKPQAKKNLILVGSSMGGYVSTVASKHLKVNGLFLLAPAFYRTGYKIKNPIAHAKQTAIVHGWDDEVIPVEHSIRFAQKHASDLHIVSSDHRLLNVIEEIKDLFHGFLSRLIK